MLTRGPASRSTRVQTAMMNNSNESHEHQQLAETAIVHELRSKVLERADDDALSLERKAMRLNERRKSVMDKVTPTTP